MHVLLETYPIQEWLAFGLIAFRSTATVPVEYAMNTEQSSAATSLGSLASDGK